MPLNLPGVPFKLSPQDMGAFDIGQALRSGFDTYQKSLAAKATPKKIANDLLAQQLGNRLKSIQADYAAPMQEAQLKNISSSIGLKNLQSMEHPLKMKMLEAQAAHYGQPSLNPMEKAIMGSERIKQMYGENSPQYNMAKDYANKIAQGSQGMQLSVDPETGAVNFSQGGSSLGGNRQQQAIVDTPEGKKMIFKAGNQAMNSYQKSALANSAREYIAKNLEQPYLGSGANADILNDRLNYDKEKDPIKKKEIGDRLVLAAVAEKIAPEYGSLQLSAQNVTPTVSSLHEQEKAIKQGWPEALSIVVNNLPRELQKEAQRLHAIKLGDVSNAKNDFLMRGMPIELTKAKQEDGGRGSPIKKMEFGSAEEFRNYLHSLTPEQRDQAKKLYLGGK